MPHVGQPFKPYKLFVGAFLPNALLECHEISPSAKIAWARLAQFSGKNGKAHPKLATLALKIGLSERQTQRVITELESAGFIQTIKATGQQRLLHFPDTYIFLWHPCLDVNRSPGPDINVTSGLDGYVTSNTRESLQENKENPISLSGNICSYCGVSQDKTGWAFDYDHFIPVIAGGTNEPSNLVLACHHCNQIKQKRIFPTIETARAFIHSALWNKNRARYVELRKICFNGQPPEGWHEDKGDDGFHEFWNAYPKKVAKKAAYKAWCKLKPDSALQQTLLSKLEHFKTSTDWQKERGKYIPHPSTWLSQERWHDELPSSDDDLYPFPVDDEVSHAHN